MLEMEEEGYKDQERLRWMKKGTKSRSDVCSLYVNKLMNTYEIDY